MSSEKLWELFTETGDIGYYLLYLESNDQNDASHEKSAIQGIMT